MVAPAAGCGYKHPNNIYTTLPTTEPGPGVGGSEVSWHDVIKSSAETTKTRRMKAPRRR